MKKNIHYLSLILLLSQACHAQSTRNANSSFLGGPCEGCEAIYEYGDKVLSDTDTLPTYAHTEPKLKITGTVLKFDGRTPAPNVNLYIYHTNRQGIYEKSGDETGWGRRHGYIRGWVKTNVAGQYTFYTFRPAHYPDGSETEHIHIVVKEPDRKEYYIDEYVFSDDPLLTTEKKKILENRGGSGIVKPVLENGMYTIRRDIILGLNIPHYE